MNIPEFFLLLLAAWIVWHFVLAIAAFQKFQDVQRDGKARADAMLSEELRRHGQAVADAREWGRAQHQAQRAREAVQTVLRG